MTQEEFFIPRQTDRTLLTALASIQNEIVGELRTRIEVEPHYGTSSIPYQVPLPNQSNELEYVLRLESEVMPRLWLKGIGLGGNGDLIIIERKTDKPFDLVKVPWHPTWNSSSTANKSQIYVILVALARKHLRAGDANASVSADTENQWARYHDAQHHILNSLQSTQAGLLGDLQRKTLEAENTAKAKYDKLEAELKAELQAERQQLGKEYSEKKEALKAEEAELYKREASFETKEAIYVARQKAEKQISELKQQLEGWNLTKGTTGKRTPVWIATGIGLATTLGLTVWFSYQTNQLFSGQALDKIHWWEWLMVSLKTLGAFSAFVSILVFLIRWSNQWAKQHSEEEFRARARVLDIGRSMWLVEVMRDAQENDKTIPPDLLKELSRNLFSEPGTFSTSDSHPPNTADLLLAGLSSMRVKTPDGTEVEAKREKPTK